MSPRRYEAEFSVFVSTCNHKTQAAYRVHAQNCFVLLVKEVGKRAKITMRYILTVCNDMQPTPLWSYNDFSCAGAAAGPAGQVGQLQHGAAQQDDLSSLLEALAAVFRVRPGLWYDGEAPEAYPHVSGFMSYVRI